MNCAMSSLPAPLSPVMNTDALVGATLRACSTAARNEGAVPSSNILSLLAPGLAAGSCARVSRATMTECAARPTAIWSCVPVNGLGI